ncbi:HK97 family phage protein [Anopheles sinensis]|uniref:HK97 family phage protein n=1 Tax=Anopheles sinensis TaxID=74873 RepID=A0A084WGS3_ANOSI|nr:HK97 family phage protein [Anopheles sinensis]
MSPARTALIDERHHTNPVDRYPFARCLSADGVLQTNGRTFVVVGVAQRDKPTAMYGRSAQVNVTISEPPIFRMIACRSGELSIGPSRYPPSRSWQELEPKSSPNPAQRQNIGRTPAKRFRSPRGRSIHYLDGRISFCLYRGEMFVSPGDCQGHRSD